MGRLILGMCALGVLSGCGKPAAQDAKRADEGKRALVASAAPAQVAEDFIAGSWEGSRYDILAVKERATALRSTPAVAVYVQWKLDGEDGPRHDLLLVQDGRVKSCTAFDATRTIEEN